MKKIIYLIVSIVLIMTFTVNLSACDNTDNDQLPVLNDNDYQIWSAPSTVKIKQDEIDYTHKGEKSLYFNTVKNEYESNQLIVTAKEDIEYFYLSVADLSSGENNISKDNISVYYQKYVEVFANVDVTIYGKAYYPDALIPVDAAKEAGELSIKKNNNGAFWITVYIPKDTVAGEYTGSFKLSINNKIIDIPVTVNVNDYTLSDEINAKTLFSWRYIRVGSGEMDSSIEMMEHYYDFLLDYRVSSQNLPIESLNAQEIVEAAKKYYDLTSTYTLTTSLGDIASGLLSRATIVKEQLLALAKESNTDRNLLDKLMIYFIDEPNVSREEVLIETINKIKSLNDILEEVVDIIDADSENYQSFKQIDGGNWQKYILDIPNIIPTYVPAINAMIERENDPLMQEYLHLANTVCPTFDSFSDDVREQMLSLFERYDINLWWYGCSLPRAPYSTFHIADTNLLSARSISWLQKKYDVLGNLYWDVAAYTDELPARYNEPIDVYTFPYRRSDLSFPAGDGFMTYPGAAYNRYGPFPSLRLMSFRDGMEEYELLLDIEENYKQLISEYGEDIDIKKVMERLYQTLYYDGTKLYADYENNLDFNRLRKEMIDMLFESTDDCGFIISSIETSDNNSLVTYYVKEGYEVYIDEQLQNPVEGRKYTKNLHLTQSTSIKFVIKQQGVEKYTYTKHIGNPVIILNNFDSYDEVPEQIMVTQNSSVFINTDSVYATNQKSLGFNISSYFTGDEYKDMIFRPSLSISTEIFESDVNFEDLTKIVFDAYNPTDYYDIAIRLYSGESYYDCGNYRINQGKTKVTVTLAGAKFSKMDSVDRIVMQFKNSGDIENPKEYRLYIDNLFAT